MEYAKKAALGGYKIVGEDDPDMSHVVLTKAEYKKLNDEIRQSKWEVEAEKRRSANALFEKTQELQEIHKKEIRKEQEATKTEKAAKEEAERQWDYCRELNENLLRISRERANADRKLKPKKEHTGYAVISSVERDFFYKGKRGQTESVKAWETVLQTPYSVDFTADQARAESNKLYASDENGNWMIEKIGINGYYTDGYAKMLAEADAADWLTRNVVISTKLKANYRNGYWELILMHTKPLGPVPEDMR